jgi:hypothetical protein
MLTVNSVADIGMLQALHPLPLRAAGCSQPWWFRVARFRITKTASVKSTFKRQIRKGIGHNSKIKLFNNCTRRRCNLKSALISVNLRLENNWEMEQYQIIYRKNFTTGEWVSISAGHEPGSV